MHGHFTSVSPLTGRCKHSAEGLGDSKRITREELSFVGAHNFEVPIFQPNWRKLRNEFKSLQVTVLSVANAISAGEA